jgi:hypothetical protein
MLSHTVFFILVYRLGFFHIILSNMESPVSIVAGYGLDGRRNWGSIPDRYKRCLPIEPTQPPIQWILGGGGLFPWGKVAGGQSDHSSLSSVEVKNSGAIPPPYILNALCLNNCVLAFAFIGIMA